MQRKSNQGVRSSAASSVCRLVGATLVTLAISLFTFGGVASANTITEITADCARVTVHFHDFPAAGVMVHIAVLVRGEPPISSDVLVTSETSEADIDISTATDELHGATADVDVDVTWTLWGERHVHTTRSVTCGTAMSTTSAAPTTTATATSSPETTTTVRVLGSTTAAGPSTTATFVRRTPTTGPVTPQGGTTPPTTTPVPVVLPDGLRYRCAHALWPDRHRDRRAAPSAPTGQGGAVTPFGSRHHA